MKLESYGSVWGAFSHSAEGMKNSGVGMATAAGEIATNTQRVLNGNEGKTPDVVDARRPPALQDSFIDLKRESYAHLANGRVMKSADSLLESLLESSSEREK